MPIDPRLIEVLKNMARPSVRRARRLIRDGRGAVKWTSVHRDIRRRHPSLITAIDERDEMYLYGIDNENSPQMSEAVYLQAGEGMLGNLRDALRRHGVILEHAESVLDFACGHGRVTRWLVEACGADHVTAADINPQAVDFVRDTFKVDGFYSTKAATDLFHSRKYQVIFVASLFSHLSLTNWKEWAFRLASMLESNGLLVFSTHGMGNYAKHRPDIQRRFEKLAEGFLYNSGNETQGRLGGEYYGTAYVSEEFVRGVFAETRIADITHYAAHGLLNYQDLYTARRHPA